ncbi:MAG: class II aldolase/adducin family protein [Planctomycetes bacterium]|nr:class II aldolase/adducin family protein [Planctomycetota bacterium]
MPTYESLEAEREQLAYFMRRLYRQQLTTTSGGNLSLRVDDNTVLITPSAIDKGELQAGEIAMFTLAGENLTPQFKSSIETSMHLSVLRRRPDVMAVVHAHPVTATAFAAMDMDINCHLTAEAYAILGNPVRAPYCMMGSEGLAKIVADCLASTDVALMQNHGVIAVGPSLLNAFDKLEVLENAAKMTWIATTMQSVRTMTAEQRGEIDQAFRK